MQGDAGRQGGRGGPWLHLLGGSGFYTCLIDGVVFLIKFVSTSE